MIGKKTGLTGTIIREMSKIQNIAWNFNVKSTNRHYEEKLDF
jgi:hypothetical protein